MVFSAGNPDLAAGRHDRHGMGDNVIPVAVVELPEIVAGLPERAAGDRAARPWKVDIDRAGLGGSGSGRRDGPIVIFGRNTDVDVGVRTAARFGVDPRGRPPF